MSEPSDTDCLQLDYRYSMFLIRTALLVIAFALALLAYVDAPVTDVALVLVVLATLSAMFSVAAAALSYQYARARLDRSCERARRVALVALMAAVLLASVACSLTLELKRYDSNDAQQADTTSAAT